MTNLITEARELCQKYIPCENREYAYDDICRDCFCVSRKRNELVAELCDALEKAEEQNKQLLHEVCKLACESVEREKILARLEAEVMARLEEHHEDD